MNIRSRFTHDLADLQHHLLELAETVDRTIVSAVWSCTRNDIKEAQRTLKNSEAIDVLCRNLENHALQVLACQQPLVASDLRTVSAMLLLTNELARIGAYACGIGTLVLRSASLKQQQPPTTLIQMGHKARAMLQHAIRAVIRRDATVSTQLCNEDTSVDALHTTTVQELLALMQHDPLMSEWATYQLWIAHNIERMADRSITIAERAAFIVTGTQAACCVRAPVSPPADLSTVVLV